MKLSSTTEDRMEAVHDLIAFFRNKYDESEFKIHKDLEFVYSSERGIHVRAVKDINEKEILMKIPKAERISYTSICNPEIQVTPNYSLSFIIAHFAIFLEVVLSHQPDDVTIDQREVATVVIIMYLLHNDTRFSHHVKTWPTEEDIEEMYEPYRDNDGTFLGHLGRNIQRENELFF